MAVAVGFWLGFLIGAVVLLMKFAIIGLRRECSTEVISAGPRLSAIALLIRYTVTKPT